MWALRERSGGHDPRVRLEFLVIAIGDLHAAVELFHQPYPRRRLSLEPLRQPHLAVYARLIGGEARTLRQPHQDAAEGDRLDDLGFDPAPVVVLLVDPDP